MNDMQQRDLSGKDVSELTWEERQELRRRYQEFVGILREKGGLDSQPDPKAKPQAAKPWNPRAMSRRDRSESG